MNIVHLVTIHAVGGKAAATLIMAGIAVVLKSKKIVWWVAAAPGESNDIKIMAMVPKNLPQASLDELLNAYLMKPDEITLEDLE